MENLFAHSAEKRVTVRSTIIEIGSSNSWSSVEEWFWYAFFRKPNKSYIAITEMNDVYATWNFKFQMVRFLSSNNKLFIAKGLFCGKMVQLR